LNQEFLTAQLEDFTLVFRAKPYFRKFRRYDQAEFARTSMSHAFIIGRIPATSHLELRLLTAFLHPFLVSHYSGVRHWRFRSRALARVSIFIGFDGGGDISYGRICNYYC